MGHPLKKELTIEIGAEDDIEMTARRAIVAVIRYLLGLFDTMEREWLTITGTVAELPALPAPSPASQAEGEAPPLPPANVPNPRARTGKTKALAS